MIVWDDGLGKTPARPAPLALHRDHPRRAGAGDPELRGAATRWTHPWGSSIDLNDVWRPPVRYDLREIRRALVCDGSRMAAGACFRMRACRQTARRCAAPICRAARRAARARASSTCTGPRAGWGYDHATGECAGPIDLIHHSHRTDRRRRSSRRRHRARGLDRPPPARDRRRRQSRPQPRDRAHPGRLRALAGSVGETLSAPSRGLQDPACPDLLFNPDLTDFDTQARLARHGRPRPRWRRRADRRHPSHLPAR